MKWGIIILAGIMLMGCSQKESADSIAAKKLIDSLVNIIEPLDTREALAYWNATETGSQEAYDEKSNASMVRNKLYSDKAVFNQLVHLRKSKNIKDNMLKRQIEVLYLSYLPYQTSEVLLAKMVEIQNAAEQEFNTFRGEMKGIRVSGNDIKNILRTSENSEKSRNAWEASKQIGPRISEDLVQLAKLRNKAAEEVGYDNFYEMQLATQEIKVDQLVRIFDELAESTEKPFKELKKDIDAKLADKFEIDIDEIQAWHYADPFFQEAPAVAEIDLDEYYEDQDVVDLAIKFYGGINLPVDDILARSSLYEKEGKYPHAYCTAIDKEGDVRVMMNVRPTEGWMSTTLHELGHALYDVHLGEDLPYLLKNPSHSFTTEAVAMFFEKLSKNPQWMDKMFGVPEEEKTKISKVSKDALRMEKLIFSRWAQVMMRFEKGFYENPERDLNQFWWDLVEKYQFIPKPEGRDEPDWATKIHICAYPVYYHNYMLGELMVAQLFHTIMQQQGVEFVNDIVFVKNTEMGRYFLDYIFRPGMKYRWDDLLVFATKEALNPNYFIDQFE